jgi:hypothetical protein
MSSGQTGGIGWRSIEPSRPSVAEGTRPRQRAGPGVFLPLSTPSETRPQRETQHRPGGNLDAREPGGHRGEGSECIALQRDNPPTRPPDDERQNQYRGLASLSFPDLRHSFSLLIQDGASLTYIKE